mgnify:CR=1 FL=1
MKSHTIGAGWYVTLRVLYRYTSFFAVPGNDSLSIVPWTPTFRCTEGTILQVLFPSTLFFVVKGTILLVYRSLSTQLSRLKRTIK